MKYILILILLLTGNQAKDDTQLLGTWVGVHMLTVQMNAEKDIEVLDNNSSDEFPLEETEVDSLYKILPSIVEFSAKGKMLILGNKLTNGKWENINNEIVITMNSLLFKGEVKDSTLTLEAEFDQEKVILKFIKVKNNVNLNYKRNKIKKNTYLKTTVNDSVVKSYFFLDSKNVVIRDLYGVHTAKYEKGSINGLIKLAIYNSYLQDYSSLYLFENSNKSIFVQDKHFDAPDLIYSRTQESKLLSIEERNKIQNTIVGSWSTVSSFTNNSSQNRGREFSELKMKLEFKDSELTISISGTDSAQKNKYEYELKGKWNLSPTGEYLTFWNNVNTPDMIEELIPINIISNEIINIGYSYKSLLNNYEYFSDSKIELMKN